MSKRRKARSKEGNRNRSNGQSNKKVFNGHSARVYPVLNAQNTDIGTNVIARLNNQKDVKWRPFYVWSIFFDEDININGVEALGRTTVSQERYSNIRNLMLPPNMECNTTNAIIKSADTSYIGNQNNIIKVSKGN